MNRTRPPLAVSHSLSSQGFPLTPFVRVYRQKAAGPFGGPCLTKPAYRLSSSAA